MALQIKAPGNNTSGEKVTSIGKYRKFMETVPQSWKYATQLLIASIISNKKYELHHPPMFSRQNAITADTIHRSNDFCASYDPGGSELTIHIFTPELPPITTVEEMMNPIDVILSHDMSDKTRANLAAKYGNVTFDDPNVRSKMLEFVKRMQANISNLKTRFNHSLVYSMIDFIKAMAYLNGSEVVTIHDLRCFEAMADNEPDRLAYMNEIDSIVNDYNAIATNMRAEAHKIMTAVEAARSATQQGKPINFFNPDIPLNISLDDFVAVSTANLQGILNETIAMLDGKGEASQKPYLKPLFELKTYVDQSITALARGRSIR